MTEHAEPQRLAQKRAEELRCLTYSSLVSDYLGKTVHEEAIGDSGKRYCLDVQASWDTVDKPGNLRVLVTVDPGPGRRPRRLVSEDFILAPDGVFVGD